MLTEGDDGFFSYTAAGISTDEEAAREVAKITGIEFTTNNLRTVRLQLIGQLRKNITNLTGIHSAGITALREEIDALKVTLEAQQEETVTILSRLTETENTIVRAMHALNEMGKRVDKLSAFKGAGHAIESH